MLLSAFFLAARLRRPDSRPALARWVTLATGLALPDGPVCPHHQTPLDYLAHSFFELPQDPVVWACRGGGKTMLGAVATLLDLVFKPGLQVRILGGSLDQSDKMFAYLRRLTAAGFADLLAAPPTRRRLVFSNGSRAEILPQSDRAVRGQRVQKLRCDEIDLFDPAVWQAAQLATRSIELPDGRHARGTVEAFSTMHKPGGPMQTLLQPPATAECAPAAPAGRATFAWCIWDVIARCPPTRPCDACLLWDDCQGRAKHASGFVPVDDVIAMSRRVSRPTWNHEMLCHPPRPDGGAFPAFARHAHVRPWPLGHRRPTPDEPVPGPHGPLAAETLVAGVDFGFRGAFVCLWVAMLRAADGRRVAWAVDELVTRERTLAANVAAVRARDALLPARVYCDVAGRGRNSHTGLSDEAVLRAAGFAVRSAPMGVEDGVAFLNELIDPALGGGHAPRLFVDPRCPRLIAALEGYRRAPDGALVKDGAHDHLIDALRYALVNHDRAPGALTTRTY
jgi:hypothetical protein